MMRRGALLLCVVLSGVVGVIVFGYFALQDWAALQAAYHHFEEVARSSPDTTTLLIAEAKQNAHRINLFAEGVWTLLCAILAAIGIHGLCVRENHLSRAS
jgi:hypothetical protein